MLWFCEFIFSWLFEKLAPLFYSSVLFLHKLYMHVCLPNQIYNVMKIRLVGMGSSVYLTHNTGVFFVLGCFIVFHIIRRGNMAYIQLMFYSWLKYPRNIIWSFWHVVSLLLEHNINSNINISMSLKTWYNSVKGIWLCRALLLIQELMCLYHTHQDVTIVSQKLHGYRLIMWYILCWSF